jgi:hypothetical protein
LGSGFLNKPIAKRKNHYKKEKAITKRRFLNILPIAAICIWLGFKFGAPGWLIAFGLAGLTISAYTAAVSTRRNRTLIVQAAAALLSVSFIVSGISHLRHGGERAAALEVRRLLIASAVFIAVWAFYAMKKQPSR